MKKLAIHGGPKSITKFFDLGATYFEEERQASVSREITKLHEETVRGTLKELIQHFEETAPRGEFVLVVAGKK